MSAERRRRLDLRRAQNGLTRKKQQQDSNDKHGLGRSLLARTVKSTYKTTATATPADAEHNSKRLLRRKRHLSNCKSMASSEAGSSLVSLGAPPPAVVSPRKSSSSSSASGADMSPAGSTSETSDYQRSTPSPRDVEEWPAAPPAAAGSASGGPSSDLMVDQGFSEEPLAALAAPSPPATPATRRSRLNNNSSEQLKLRQVRVALEKMDDSALRRHNGASPPKRRHSDCHLMMAKGDAASKKARVASVCLETAAERHKAKHSSAAHREVFSELRKRKLDMFLNLKTDAGSSNGGHIQLFPPPPPPPPPPPVANRHSFLSSSPTAPGVLLASTCLSSSSSSATSPSCPSSSSSAHQQRPLSSSSSSSASSSSSNPIRFPVARNPAELVLCKWQGCEVELDSTGKLLDHLKLMHALSQNPNNEDDFSYKCLWQGCKVFGKSSSSRSWLEKHVTNHGGNKPFACIVDSCKMRFGTQSLLERHVNAHFNKATTQGDGPAEGNDDSHDGANFRQQHQYLPSPSAVKVIRKAGKKLKFRKTIYSARNFDLFDVGVMAQMQEKIVNLCVAGRHDVGIDSDHGLGMKVTVHSQIKARRTTTEDGGEKKVMHLVRWAPAGILPDEWLPPGDVLPSKVVRLASLPYREKQRLVSAHLLRTPDGLHQRRKSTCPEVNRMALS